LPANINSAFHAAYRNIVLQALASLSHAVLRLFYARFFSPPSRNFFYSSSRARAQVAPLLGCWDIVENTIRARATAIRQPTNFFQTNFFQTNFPTNFKPVFL
jgi:hypothetical protein